MYISSLTWYFKVILVMIHYIRMIQRTREGTQLSDPHRCAVTCAKLRCYTKPRATNLGSWELSVVAVIEETHGVHKSLLTASAMKTAKENPLSFRLPPKLKSRASPLSQSVCSVIWSKSWFLRYLTTPFQLHRLEPYSFKQWWIWKYTLNARKLLWPIL
jgi:hypothetical protein